MSEKKKTTTVDTLDLLLADLMHRSEIAGRHATGTREKTPEAAAARRRVRAARRAVRGYVNKSIREARELTAAMISAGRGREPR